MKTIKIKVSELQRGDRLNCGDGNRAVFQSFGGFGGFVSYVFGSGRRLSEPVPISTDLFRDELPKDSFVTVDREEA